MIDFSTLSDEELKTYVLHNRSDTVAFHAYVDRMQQRPPLAIIEPEEWSEERMQQILDEKTNGRQYMELKSYAFTKGSQEDQIFHLEMVIIWAQTLEDAQQQLQQQNFDWQSFHFAGESTVPLGQPLAISTNIPLWR